MKSFTLLFSLLFIFQFLFSQVDIDKPINLTGLTSNAKVSGIKDVSLPTDAVSAVKLQNGALIYGGTAGFASNTYTVSITPASLAITALSPGMVINFKANDNNTGAASLKVDALTALPIKKDGGNSLTGGEIVAGQMVSVMYDGTNFQLVSQRGGTGSVTSVGLALPSFITVSNSPVTTSGTLTGTLSSQTANQVFSAPNGSNGTPAFRALVPADIPALDASKITTGPLGVTVGGTGTGTAFTPGSVVFAGTGGVYSQNNTKFFWDNTNARLGVGLNTPQAALDVRSGDDNIVIFNNTNNAMSIQSYVDGHWSDRTTYAPSETRLLLQPDVGNVGVGTTNPQKPLDVGGSGGIRISQSGNAVSTNELFFQDNGQIRSLDDNHRIIFDRASNIMELRECGNIIFSPGCGGRSQLVTFKSDGNVGIGITSPTSRLDVASATRSGTHGTGLPFYVTGNINGNSAGMEFRHTNGSQGIGLGYNTIYATGSNTDQDLGMQARGAGDLIFNAGSAERVRITATGKVRITSPSGTNTGYIEYASPLETNADWRLVFRNDFEVDNEGWVAHTSPTLTTAATVTGNGTVACTGGVLTGNKILTNYGSGNTANTCFKKNVDLTTVPHSEVKVRITYYFIDSWDGERGKMGISTANNVAPITFWTGTYDYSYGQASVIGSANEDYFTRQETEFKSSANTFWIMVNSSLDEGAGNESFGIDNVEVWVR